MTAEKITKLFLEIKLDIQKYGYRDIKETDKRISEEDLEYNELLDLMILFAKSTDFFRWYLFLMTKLIDLVSDDDKYIQLLIEIINKVKNDMAQGEFIEVLIHIGETEDLSGHIYDALISSGEEDVHHYAGILLGAIGRTKNKNIVKLLIRDLNDANYSEKRRASVLVSAQIIMEKDAGLDNIAIYDELANIASASSADLMRLQGVVFLVELYRLVKKNSKDVTKYKEYLERVFINVKPNVLRGLVEKVHYRGLDDPEYEFELVEKCSNHLSKQIAGSICYYLASKNDINKKASFEILIKILSDDNLIGQEIGYPLEQMGKQYYDFYKKELIDLVNRTNNIALLYELRYDADYLCKNELNYEQELKELTKLIQDKITKLYADKKTNV